MLDVVHRPVTFAHVLSLSTFASLIPSEACSTCKTALSHQLDHTAGRVSKKANAKFSFVSFAMPARSPICRAPF